MRTKYRPKAFYFVIALLLISFTATVTSGHASEEEEEQNYKVLTVKDGDTIQLENLVTIRLMQIDAPEASGKRECFGKESTEILRELIGSDLVSFRSDSIIADHDSHGRPVRYIFIGERNINLELIQRGAAAPQFHDKKRGQFAEEFLDAAKKAKKERIGLWGVCPKTKLDANRGVETGEPTPSLEESNVAVEVVGGRFCKNSLAGMTGLSKSNKLYVCAKDGEGRYRWRLKQ
jgi:endonuclease YncB( thermonuclease family)